MVGIFERQSRIGWIKPVGDGPRIRNTAMRSTGEDNLNGDDALRALIDGLNDYGAAAEARN